MELLVNGYFADVRKLTECDEYQKLQHRQFKGQLDVSLLEYAETICSISSTVALATGLDAELCRAIAVARNVSISPLPNRALGFDRLGESLKIATKIGISSEVLDEICETPKTKEGKLVKLLESKVVKRLNAEEITKIAEEIIESR